MAGKSVLVTGASGFAGRHLAHHCSEMGDRVAGVSRRPATLAGIAHHETDLADAAATGELISGVRPARIFHLAAKASVARSWEDPTEVIVHNLVSTVNLLEAVRAHCPDARVLVAGSGEQYGPPEELPITEEHPQRPRSPYAVSKAAAGFYADAFGLRVVRTRAFNHAGPGQGPTYVVASLARQIAEAEARAEQGEDRSCEIVTGNLLVRRDFTDVRDVVRAYRLAIEQEETVCNVCSGRSIAVGDILAGLARHSWLEVGHRTDSKLVREGEVMEIRGSNERLRDATGWTPEIPLDRTLADTLDWWRARTGVEVTR
jgi:GDP-4-dehydro-6-deoxy-D-mannose reductase